MPKTIDDTVVSIEFDNKKFEKNAKQSMSTIDKLKAKLRFKKENRLSDEFNNDVKNIDISPMETALNKFSLKCSAFEIARITGIQRIVNAAISAGTNITRQLTTVPVSTGFSEYEEKMGSVQTIMSSTGASVEEVKDALEKLNVYADKTIYSFKDMTSNIGKFTNAGVELNTAVDAIRGVSNVAAISGANTAEASRAMYNLAQSLSAGYVKLIDWKSIENANMATKGFKENLLETAAAMGKVKKNADGTYKTLKGTALTATRNFNETLQEQWLTTDVLIKTLRDYADETTEIGKKAYAAAQDVKTLSMLFDTLKEAVQSGWGTTWELIIGDFEEAKSFLSEMSDVFSGFISKMADARNYLLMGGLSKQSNNWKKINNAIAKTGITTEEFNNALIDTGKKYVSNLDNILSSSGSFDESLKKGWLNADIITETFKKFNDSLSDTTKTYTEEQKEIIKELYKSASEQGGVVNNLIANIDKYGGSSGRENLLAGIINIFSAVAKLTKAVGAGITAAFGKTNSKTVYNLTDRFQKFTKSLIISDEVFEKITRTVRGVASAFKFVGDILKTGFTIALQVVCDLLGIAGNSVLDLTANLGDWLHQTVQNLKANEALKELFVTIASAVRIAAKFLGILFTKIRSNKRVVSGFNKVLKFMSDFIKDIGNYLAGGVKAFSKWFESLKSLDGFTFDNLKTAFNSFVTDVIGYFFKFENAFGNVGKTIDAIGEKLKGIWTGFIDDFKSKYTAVYNVIKQIYDRIVGFLTKKKNTFDQVLAQGLNKGTIAALISTLMGAWLIKGVNKIGAALGVVADIAKGTGDVLGEIGLAIRRLSKGLTRYFDASAFVKLAISVAILTASLIGLAFVPYDKLEAAVPVLIKLSALFLGLSFAMMIMNKIGGSAGAPGGLIATIVAVMLFVKNLAAITNTLTEFSGNLDKWLEPFKEAETMADYLATFGKQVFKIATAAAVLTGAVAIFAVFMKALASVKDLSIKGAISLAIMMGVLYLFNKSFMPLFKDTVSKLLDHFTEFIEKMKTLYDNSSFGGKMMINSALGTVTALVVSLVASLFALKKVLEAAVVAVQPIVRLSFQLAASMLIVTATAWLLNKMNVEDILGALVYVIGGMGAIAYMMAKFAKAVDGIKEIPKIGKALFSLAASMLLIVGAISLLSWVAKNNQSGITTATMAVGAIIIGLTTFAYVTAGKDFESVANSIFKIGITIGIVTAAIAALSYFINDKNSEAIKEVALAAIGLAFVIILVIAAVKGLNKATEKAADTITGGASSKSDTKIRKTERKYEGVWQAIAAFASTIAEIAGIIYLFTTKVDWDKDSKGFWFAVGGITLIVAAVGAVLLAISRLGNSTKKADTSSSSTTFTGKTLAIVMTTMAGLAYIVSMIIPIAGLPVENVLAAGSAILMSVGAIALIMTALSSLSSDGSDVTGKELGAIITVVAGVIGLALSLSLLANQDLGSIISAGAVITVLAGVITGIIAMFVKMTTNTAILDTNALSVLSISFGVIAGSLSVLALALTVLATQDYKSILAAGGVIAAIAFALTAVIAGLAEISKGGGDMLAAAGSFAIMSVGVIAIAGALALLSATMDPSNMLSASISLVILMGVLTGILELVSKVGGPMALAGAGAFAIMAAGVLIICAGLSQLSEIDSGQLITAAIAIGIIAGVMTVIVNVLASLVATGVGALALAGAVAVILAIAAAVLMMANAVKIAAEGFQIFVNSVALLPIILDLFFNNLLDIITKSKENAELAYEAGSSLLSRYIRGVTDGIRNNYPTMEEKLSNLKSAISSYLSSETYYNKGILAGQGLMQGLSFGIINGIEGVNTAITSAFGIIDDNISNEIDTVSGNIAAKQYKFQNSGVFLMQGLNNGIVNPLGSILSLMFNTGEGMIDCLNEALGVHSPSWKTKESAENTADGFTNEITAKLPDINASGQSFGTEFLSGTQSVLGDATLGDILGTSGSKMTAEERSGQRKAVLMPEKVGTGEDSDIQAYEDYQKKKSEEKTNNKDLITGISDSVSNAVKNLGSGSSTNGGYIQTWLNEKTAQIKNFLEESSKSSGADTTKLYEKEYENYKIYIDALEKTKKALEKASPERASGYQRTIGFYEKQIENVLKKGAGYAGVEKEAMRQYWNTAGAAFAEVVSSTSNNSGNNYKSAMDYMNGILGNMPDWSKWFGSGDDKDETNKNTKSILDALNQQNSILGSGLASEKSYTFVQNNYSPKALSTVEIYRQTNNQLSRLGRKGW